MIKLILFGFQQVKLLAIDPKPDKLKVLHQFE